MMFKYPIIITIVLLSFLIAPTTYAYKQIVEITPVDKITTAGENLSEGDYCKFKVIDNGDIIEGLVVKYEENGFAGKTAVLVLDNFRTIKGDGKYSGTISLEGNPHNGIMEFLEVIIPEFVRGGEVSIYPNRDKFSLWRE